MRFEPKFNNANELTDSSFLKWLITLVICIIFAPLGATELTIKAYVNAPLAKKSEYRGYVIGAASALGWANAVNENRGLPPLFCAPDDQGISPSLSLAILDAEIRDVRFGKDSTAYQTRTVTQSLLLGYKKRFPCSQPSVETVHLKPMHR